MYIKMNFLSIFLFKHLYDFWVNLILLIFFLYLKWQKWKIFNIKWKKGKIRNIEKINFEGIKINQYTYSEELSISDNEK